MREPAVPGTTTGGADPGRVVVLGGSGFVGRRLAQELAGRAAGRPVYVIHRSRPDWLAAAPVEARTISLDDAAGLRMAIEGAGAVVNLLRPDGSGWYAGLLRSLLPAVAAAGVGRLLHVSSIDVYGSAPGRLIDEDTPPVPQTPYAREHLEAERLARAAMPRTVVLRLGAVFGPGGRNVVAFAREAQCAPLWRLTARRALYARRRMHLVSVEAVCAIVADLALGSRPAAHGTILVTDDDDERNNFAFMQDVLASAFGRGVPAGLPMLPAPVLEALLRLRGKPAELVRRRFSGERMRALGLRRPDFGTCLEAYARRLATERSDGP